MKKTIRVVITGPECSGKSTLAAQLAGHYHSGYIPEYARDFIASLNRPYTYEDVLHIAEVQLVQARSGFDPESAIVFLDTWLVITKVWFEVVYGQYPEWIDEALGNDTIDLYLLCDTSIPWTADKVRENGGEMREVLFLKYKTELERLKCKYALVRGTGPQRLTMAVEAIDHFFPDICR